MAEEFGLLLKSLWSGKLSWANGNGIRVCSTFVSLSVNDDDSLVNLELCRQKTSRIRWKWST